MHTSSLLLSSKKSFSYLPGFLFFVFIAGITLLSPNVFSEDTLLNRESALSVKDVKKQSAQNRRETILRQEKETNTFPVINEKTTNTKSVRDSQKEHAKKRRQQTIASLDFLQTARQICTKEHLNGKISLALCMRNTILTEIRSRIAELRAERILQFSGS